jgi:cysteinyl-tRNA synthetase
MDSILALNLKEVFHEEKAEDPAFVREIEALIAERAEAKKAKNFARSDEIRNQMKERGIILTDAPSGTLWKRV